MKALDDDAASRNNTAKRELQRFSSFFDRNFISENLFRAKNRINIAPGSGGSLVYFLAENQKRLQLRKRQKKSKHEIFIVFLRRDADLYGYGTCAKIHIELNFLLLCIRALTSEMTFRLMSYNRAYRVLAFQW